MEPITIESIQTYLVALPLVEPLETSFGVEADKEAILIEVQTTLGSIGWGEVSVGFSPGYGPETIKTAQHILHDFIVPKLLGLELPHPSALPEHLAHIRGHHHTKAGVEAAIWDAYGKENAYSLVQLFIDYLQDDSAPRTSAWVGVSIGIQSSIDKTKEIIEKRLAQGYERIKLKIKPGWDVNLVQDVRRHYPDIMLMVDANSAYTMHQVERLMRLDECDLLMIEQPFGYDDLWEHSQLQKQIHTPICLDESVRSEQDLRVALELSAGQILNLKPARVGGFTESLEIYKLCRERNLPLWIGGMLETGVGRAANLALASLPGVTLPCDISATDRYFEMDITEPRFTLDPGSTIKIPQGDGIGVDVQLERVDKFRVG